MGFEIKLIKYREDTLMSNLLIGKIKRYLQSAF